MDLTIEVTPILSGSNWGLGADGALTGTASLSSAFKAEKYRVTVTAEDDGNADGSNKLSVSDTLDVYIGLNVTSDDVEQNKSYTIIGSDIADDEVVTGINKFAAAGSNKTTIDLGEGSNTFFTRFTAVQGSELEYIGGDDDDSISFNLEAAIDGGKIVLKAGNGTNDLFLGNFAGANSGRIEYTGGTGVDTLELNQRVADNKGYVSLDVGNDSVGDTITFNKSVGTDNGTVLIQNFDPNAEDKIYFKELRAVDQLDYVPNGNDVIVFSTSSAPVEVLFTLLDAAVDDGGGAPFSFLDLSISDEGWLVLG